MNKRTETTEHLDAIQEQSNFLNWVNKRIRTAPEGEDLSKEYRMQHFAKLAWDTTRNILDQHYIHGITRDQLHKDINDKQ